MPVRQDRVYGWRARLGLIVPATNTVNEAEWARALPDGVTFHTTRMGRRSDPASGDRFEILADTIAAKAAELAPAEVDVVAFACTADSMMDSPDRLVEAVAARAKLRIVTTACALADALRCLRAKRVSIATPFVDSPHSRERAFFKALGVDILGLSGLGIAPGDHMVLPSISPAAVHRHAVAAFVPTSDALLLLCTDLPALPVIESLERELKVPVVTSNQATLWSALRVAGIDDSLQGLGHLLTLPLDAHVRNPPSTDQIPLSGR